MEITTTNGLQNIGNTCFLNSGLQLLIHCSDLSRLISVFDSKQPIVRQYRELVKVYRKNDGKVFNPSGVKKVLGKTHKRFRHFDQEDTHEFIINLLDDLEEAAKKDDKEVAGLIAKLFDLQMEITIQSKESKEHSTKVDPVRFLCIPVITSKSRDIDLDACFQEFVQDEDLDDWETPTKKRERAVKHTRIIKYPRNLIFQLKRYSYGGRAYRGLGHKLDNAIDIPMEWISSTGNKFALHGFVHQSGGMGFGHYTYYGKVGDKWYFFNDQSVRPIDEDHAMRVAQHSYLMSYRKIS